MTGYLLQYEFIHSFICVQKQPICSTSYINKSNDEYYSGIYKVARVYNHGRYQIPQIRCDEEYNDMMNKIKDYMDIDINLLPPRD